MPTQEMRTMGIRFWRGLLIGVAVFEVLSCLAGCFMLVYDGKGIFGDVLKDTAFAGQYVLGGLLLGLVVGGTQAVALAGQLRRSPWAWLAHAVAGFTMVIWIFGEVGVLGAMVGIHVFYFAMGLLQIGGVLVVLGLFDFSRSPDPQLGHKPPKQS